jgi:hypothetical protein
VATVANGEGEVVEEVERGERKVLVWRIEREELAIYSGGGGPRCCGEGDHGDEAAAS